MHNFLFRSAYNRNINAQLEGDIKMERLMKYYVCGHTAKGYVNYLSSNVQDMKKITLLQHHSTHFITEIIHQLIQHYKNQATIEILMNPDNKNYIDGIIFRNQSFAVLNKQIATPGLMNTRTIVLSSEIPPSDQTVIIQKKAEIYDTAYKEFHEGLLIHDELEKIYIKEMNFERADQVADELISQLFQDYKDSEQQGDIYERLFGTNTPDGMINYLNELIQPVQKRIFIKGRAGTGKSVLMKKILACCKQKGIAAEVYRCSFDPHSIDMVIIRELDCCLFDSTPPHELFPTRKSDFVIDLYKKTVTPGTDEKFEQEITRLTNAYKQKMKNGLQHLASIKRLKEYERESHPSSEVKKLSQIVEDIIKK